MTAAVGWGWDAKPGGAVAGAHPGSSSALNGDRARRDELDSAVT